MSLRECKLIDIRTFVDHRGSLSILEASNDIPFAIKRLYYLYDAPNDAVRGAHAHIQLQQLFICMAGSVTVELDDGFSKQTFRLSRANQGFFISPMNWRILYDFSPDCVCLVLASDHFSEDDYIREYDKFLKAVRES